MPAVEGWKYFKRNEYKCNFIKKEKSLKFKSKNLYEKYTTFN